MSNKNPGANIRLTSREKHVLQFISTGMTSQQIADTLFVAKATVDQHRKNMLRKFGARNCTQIIATFNDVLLK
jgi:DNA-binding CsgD family transcriptional regulator